MCTGKVVVRELIGECVRFCPNTSTCSSMKVHHSPFVRKFSYQGPLTRFFQSFLKKSWFQVCLVVMETAQLSSLACVHHRLLSNTSSLLILGRLVSPLPVLLLCPLLLMFYATSLLCLVSLSLV